MFRKLWHKPHCTFLWDGITVACHLILEKKPMTETGCIMSNCCDFPCTCSQLSPFWNTSRPLFFVHCQSDIYWTNSKYDSPLPFDISRSQNGVPSSLCSHHQHVSGANSFRQSFWQLRKPFSRQYQIIHAYTTIIDCSVFSEFHVSVAFISRRCQLIFQL